MDAYLAFTLGVFCGLIAGFGLACIRPNASEKEVAQAYEVGVLDGTIRSKSESIEALERLAGAARRVA